jgi:hypothetical protein
VSSGLYSGVSGLALGSGLYRNVSGLWGGASGLINGFGGGGPFPGASLYLDFLTPPLDSRITFSRGTNATLVDSTGKITYAPANLLVQSEGTVAQLNASGNVTDAAPSISGFTNSIQFEDNSVARFAYKTLAINGGVPLIASFFVQMNDNSAPVVGTGVTGGDLAIIIDGSYAPTVSVSLFNGNIYRVWGLLTTPTGGAFRNVGIIKNTGQSTKGFRVTGFQLEQVTYQTTPGPYVATTASAYYGPRFDYDPITLAPRGLLIEEARTNLLTYSADWSNAIWSKTNVTVTAAATTSPDGTTSAQRLAATAGASTTNVQAATVAATFATYSIYVKQGTGATTANSFALRNNTTATVLVLGTINYSTGAWTYTTGSTGVTVTNAGNGWWRIQITATSGITSGDSIQCYAGFVGGAQTAGDFLYAWGAQLEAGAFATSYIPTVASTVSRSADVATMTGTNFSTWYNAAQGTFIVDGRTVDAGAGGLVGLGTGTGTIYREFNSTASWWTGATLLGTTNSATWSSGVKVAAAYDAGNRYLCMNGAAIATNATTLPDGGKMEIGRSYNGSSNYLNGHIRAIAYYNTRLPNTQLQTLTAPSLTSPLALDFISPTYTVGY